MHLDPNLHLTLHHARTDRALAGPHRPLARAARPPGRLRAGLARGLHGVADALVAGDRAPEPRLVAARRQA